MVLLQIKKEEERRERRRQGDGRVSATEWLHLFAGCLDLDVSKVSCRSDAFMKN